MTHFGRRLEDIVCKVSHSGQRPIPFLPDRKTTPGIRTGDTLVDVEGTEYESLFHGDAL